MDMQHANRDAHVLAPFEVGDQVTRIRTRPRPVFVSGESDPATRSRRRQDEARRRDR